MERNIQRTTLLANIKRNVIKISFNTSGKVWIRWRKTDKFREISLNFTLIR